MPSDCRRDVRHIGITRDVHYALHTFARQRWECYGCGHRGHVAQRKELLLHGRLRLQQLHGTTLVFMRALATHQQYELSRATRLCMPAATVAVTANELPVAAWLLLLSPPLLVLLPRSSKLCMAPLMSSLLPRNCPCMDACLLQLSLLLLVLLSRSSPLPLHCRHHLAKFFFMSPPAVCNVRPLLVATPVAIVTFPQKEKHPTSDTADAANTTDKADALTGATPRETSCQEPLLLARTLGNARWPA